MPGRGFSTLAEWLAWQETLHPKAIDLGVDRIRTVARRLSLQAPAYPVFTVAGTNGKGSVCAYLQAMQAAAGRKVGLYTSPHLLRYNERVQIDGEPATDEALIGAFEQIDSACGETSLTYFEFGTLAALLLFQKAAVDVAILEVGLGGRLDAVNIVAADVAIITNIALDHQEWLGDTREQIAREKAGIMRAGHPVLCGDRDPPSSLLAHAWETGAPLTCLGRDFDWKDDGECWSLVGIEPACEGLPWPALPGAAQIDNAALAVAALSALGERLPWTIDQVIEGLRRATLPARIEVRAGSPEWVYDVGHNPAAALVLANWLEAHPVEGRTLAVLGMLADKDVAGFVQPLVPHVDRWLLATLAGSRGQSAETLMQRAGDSLEHGRALAYDSVAAAIAAARTEAREGDRILVCGSFHTVGAARALEL